MSLDKAILEIDADVDNDGSLETGVFVMSGNIEIQEEVRPSYAIEAFGAGAITTAQTALQLDEPSRRGLSLDIGAGQHTFEIDFTGWSGSSEHNDVSEQTLTSIGTDGDWADDAPIPVQVDFQRGVASAEETKNQFNGSINCREVFDIQTAIDAFEKLTK